MRRFSHRDEDTRQHDNLVRDADAAARKGERMKAIRFLESAVAWVPQISTLLKLADLQLEVDDADGDIKTASRAAQGNPTNLQRLHLERILGKKARRRRRRRRRRRPRRCRRRHRYCRRLGGVHAVNPLGTDGEYDVVGTEREFDRRLAPGQRARGEHGAGTDGGGGRRHAVCRATRRGLFAHHGRAQRRGRLSARRRRRQARAAQAPVDELRGRLSLDDLTAKAVRCRTRSTARSEGIAPTLAPARR